MIERTNGGNGNGNSGWLRSGAVAIIIAVASQLGFSIWWAAHMDQTTLHIIERANQLDEHITRLDTVGGAKVRELSSRMENAEKKLDYNVNRFEHRFERIETNVQQLLMEQSKRVR